MNIHKKSDGTFTVSYHKRDPVSRQPISLRRKGIKSKREAERIYRELVISVENKLKELKVPRWKELLDLFASKGDESNLGKAALENYLICLRAHTLPDWENKFVTDITGSEIRELIKLKVGQRSPQHQKSVLKYIRKIFQFAFERGAILQNPTPLMKFRGGEKIHKVLTESEVRFFLESAKRLNHEWYYHWALALYTGMRNGELFALTWDKVSFETRQIKVDTSWNNKVGFKSTKSGDDRIVEISPTLLLMLKELRLAQSDSGFVLSRNDKWEKGEQARELRLFLAGLGLSQIRFHDLRATWATLLLSKGIVPIKVMAMGGWKDLKTLMIYVRKAGVDIKGSTDCLDLHNPAMHNGQILEFSSGS
jgi:integrase